ncbi:MAG: hypothetical protein IIY23_05710 [Erysipelotrichaceae bacterium]|nr:hypothetical protein [Erysipelotrichaceae bacterium]
MEYEKNSEYSYCLGMSPLIEGLRQRPETIEKVYLSSRAKENASLEEMLRLCREYDIPVETDDKRIARLSVKENCFAIGIFRKFADRLQGSCHILLSAFEDEGFLGTTASRKDGLLHLCRRECPELLPEMKKTILSLASFTDEERKDDRIEKAVQAVKKTTW